MMARITYNVATLFWVVAFACGFGFSYFVASAYYRYLGKDFTKLPFASQSGTAAIATVIIALTLFTIFELIYVAHCSVQRRRQAEIIQKVKS